MALVEYKEQGSIGFITLNRPEKLNAFSDEVSVAFCDALYKLNDDANAQIGIISGMLQEIDVKGYAVGPRGLHLTEDFRESAAAFLEKRKPVFHGR